MTLRLCVILTALLVPALAGVSGCTGDSDSIPEPTPAHTPEPTATPTVEPMPAHTPEPTATPEPTVIIRDTGHGLGPCDSGYDYQDTFVKGRLQWSPDGSRILFTNLQDYHSPPVDFVEADGSRLGVVRGTPTHLVNVSAGPLRTFDVSPDGSRIAYSTCVYPTGGRWERHDYYEIVTSNIDGTATEKLTDNTFHDLYPVWSPDGTRVAFILGRGRWVFNDRPQALAIYTTATRKLIEVRLSTRASSIATHPPAWSPDGRSIAFLGNITRYGEYREKLGTEIHLYTVDPDGSGPGRLISNVGESNVIKHIVSNVVSAPSWSPDGKRIAVAVSEGDGATLYTYAADGSDPVRIASIGRNDPINHRWPKPDPPALWVPNVAWSPDGSKIMYGALAVVNADDGSVVLDTLPLRFDWVGLLSAGPIRSSNRPLAAWSPDGSRIAVQAVPGEYGNPSYGHYYGFPVLYTMNSDGTDVRILVKIVDDSLIAWKPTRPPADVEACSNGKVVPDPEGSPGLVEDCRTLLGMRDTLSGSETLDWSSETPIRMWTGVDVSGNPLRVRGLFPNLSLYAQVQLFGQIPPEIANLSELRVLNLGESELNGRIPPEIGNLTNLERLTLNSTQLTGPIPPEIGNLTKLTELSLAHANLSGPIPPEIGNLTNLESLGLVFNRLSGPIPPEIGNLVNLRGDLDLSGLIGGPYEASKRNEFTGSIPAELGNLVNLNKLSLNWNSLTGSIPTELSNLNLEELYLGGNELTGCIPQALRNVGFNDLDELGLGYCE